MRRSGLIAICAVLLSAAAAAFVFAGGAATADDGEDWPGNAGPQHRPEVTLAATPERAEVLPLPCFSAKVDLAMGNPGDEAVYADASVTPEGPLELDRGALSSYLPAGFTLRAPVTVTAPRSAPPGDYAVHVESGDARLSVPVTVAAPPPKGAGDNLAFGEQASASSTHGNFDVCGAVDGNRNSDDWDTKTGWNDGTRAVFPDTYEVRLAEPASVHTVDLYTLDSARYPARTNGVRDYDVQVLAGETWRTVAEVRGNTAGHVTSTFDPVVAEAVRIVVLTTNDRIYSRIVELEVRGG